MTKSQIIQINKIVDELKKVEIVKEDEQVYDLIFQITEVRKQKKITQQQLADMTAISRNTISRIETFISIPTLPVLFKLVNALGLQLCIKQQE